MDAVLENMHRSLEPGDVLTVSFQGGEPTLAGLAWFRRFAEKVDAWGSAVKVNYALQTNGVLLDDQWCQFLAERKFLVGISMDAMPKCHNGCRVDADGKGTYRQVEAAVKCMRKWGVEFNVLCTLTSQVARHPQQVWSWICENDFRYVQFTPCLDALDDPGKSVYALHPKRFASFYKTLFEYWYGNFRLGKYRSIKLFDDIVNLLAYGLPTACGIHGKCQCQMVVESDGSAYPCDFYCMDAYRLGSLTENSVTELHDSERAKAFLTRPRQRAKICGDCPYALFCGGGCHRMQREVYCAPEDTFCGYRDFLDRTMERFRRIAAQQRSMRSCR